MIYEPQNRWAKSAQGVFQQNKSKADADAWTSLTSPEAAKDLLPVRISPLEHEVSAIFLLNAQHHLIEMVALFRGALTGGCFGAHRPIL